MTTDEPRVPSIPSPWRVVALGAIVATTAWSYASERVLIGRGTMAEITARYPSLFTPAGYAFAIWGLIFAAFIAYAVATLLPGERRRAVHERIAPLLTLAFGLASAWILVFKLEQIAVSQAVIVLLLVVAAELYARVSRAVRAGELSLPWRVPFAMLVAWVGVATIANLHLTLRAGGSLLPLTPGWVIIMLALAVAVALAVAQRQRDPVVPLVVSWAAVAIAAARRDASPVVAWAALLGAAVSTVGAIVVVAPTGTGRPTTSPPPAAGPAPGPFATRARRLRRARARSAGRGAASPATLRARRPG